jgi:hypothetical protein
MIPQQISLTETRKLFDAVKAIFPNNEVAMVLGLDISVE